MKTTSNFAILILFSLVLIACKKDSSTEPSETRKINASGYGSDIDNAYYKAWSDSSWEKYNKMITVNGKTYVTLINDAGDESYYGEAGYAGFKPNGSSLILFDKPFTSMPEEINFGQVYSTETTFSLQGYSYTMKIEQTLRDTVSVTVPFGVFQSCLWFDAKSTLSSGGQSESSSSQVWLAKGPSEIKQSSNSGNTILMVRGRVNGKGWGMPYTQSNKNLSKSCPAQLLQKLAEPIMRLNQMKFRFTHPAVK